MIHPMIALRSSFLAIALVAAGLAATVPAEAAITAREAAQIAVSIS